ncbi:glutamate receptor ionotropic, NMDA 3A-like [Anticarsia gemmatalis]|uniref:glutamate receptor ionotropic, NMDA 3A-like n=1 Tax=Anticarsia gemmatalis TaxID=129554 RepID=UPI003F75D40D
MAANIALQNFDFRYATLVLFNSTLYCGVEIFLSTFNNNFVVNRGSPNPNLVRVTRQYVLFASDISDLESLLFSLKELDMVNTGNFIIVCTSQVDSDCDERIFTEISWTYRIVNVVFIKSERMGTHAFTYFPISEGLCNNIKPIKLNPPNFIQTSLGRIFGNKFEKLNSCPLFVSTFIRPPFMIIDDGVPIGADGDLLRIIAYGLNTSLVMMTPHRGTGWGFLTKNGTWTGSLADIIEDLANVSMTSAALTLSRFSNFQISFSYNAVHIIWITHPASLQSEASKLLRPFGPSTLVALTVSYALVILSAFVIKTDKWSSIFHENQYDQSRKSVVFYSWMMCMGQAVIKLPKKSVFLYVIVLWVFYCFLMRTVYQVYLIDSLTGKFYEHQLETIEEAIRGKYSFGGGPALRDYYIDYPKVFDSWKDVDSPEMVQTILDISKGKKFVFAVNTDTTRSIIKKYKVKLHRLPQRIVLSPTVIFFKKYSPLTDPINRILSRLCSAGFPEKLYKDYSAYETNHKSNEEETLKVIHFTACYVILVGGFSLSAIFFLLEVYFGKIYKHPTL